MKPLAKITFIIGFLLIAFHFATPDNYDACHSDLSISGYNNPQSRLPDIVYQFGEVFLFVGIICIFTAVVLNENSIEVDESPTSILKIK